ncbi:DivIVA domain protein [Mycobacteroides abscessus subsp. abscessus]|nr:DivIVA domain protein [Mycobacteroides abscessus subsp. abscessus]
MSRVTMTPEDVRRIHFAMPSAGHRGYHADEVDAFLDLVAATLAGHGALTADDIRHVPSSSCASAAPHPPRRAAASGRTRPR